MCNRCIKAQKEITQSAFNIMWDKFSEWAVAEGACTDGDLAALYGAVEELNGALVACEGKTAANIGGDVADKAEGALQLLEDKDFGGKMRRWAATLPPTQRCWTTAADMCCLGFRLVAADRDGDWDKHLAAVEEMVPYHFAYGKTKYARHMLVCLADMKVLAQTHPDVHASFKRGEFSCHTSQQRHTGTGMDMTLEHANGQDKAGGSGGVVGRTQNRSTVQRHCSSQHPALGLNAQWQQSLETGRRWHDVTGLDAGDNPWVKARGRHADSGPASITRHNRVVSQITSAPRDDCHLADQDQQTLDSIVFGTVCGTKLSTLALDVHEHGTGYANKHLRTFTGLHAGSSADDRKKAWGVPVKVHRHPTFSDVYTTQGAATAAQAKAAVVACDKDILHRHLVASRERDVDMTALVGDHELNIAANSLFKPNGDLRLPGNKAVMSKHFAAPTPELPPEVLAAPDVSLAVILDGNAVFQMLGRPKEGNTFKDCATTFVRAVMRRFEAHGTVATRVDVLFDRHLPLSTKNGARCKRNEKVKKTIERQLPRHDMPLPGPGDWTKHVGSEANKRRCVQYLAESLRTHCQENASKLKGTVHVSGGFEDIKEAWCSDASVQDLAPLESTHEEADTRILLHARHAKTCGCSLVVVECRDNDVRTIATALARGTNGSVTMPTHFYFQTGFLATTQCVDVNGCPDHITTQVADELVAFHACTGCDQNGQTASFTRAPRKNPVNKKGNPVGAWAVFCEHPEWFHELGRGDFDEETVMAGLQQFVCRLHDPDDLAATSVRDLRVKLFMGGEKSQSALPPTYGCLLQHALRAHHTSRTWRDCLVPCPEKLDPLEHGWGMSPHNCTGGDAACTCGVDGIPKRHYVPIITRDPMFPEKCSALTTCGCSTVRDGKRCNTKTCTCRKAGLVCTSMCRGCRGVCCKNTDDIGAKAAANPPAGEPADQAADQAVSQDQDQPAGQAAVDPAGGSSSQAGSSSGDEDEDADVESSSAELGRPAAKRPKRPKQQQPRNKRGGHSGDVALFTREEMERQEMLKQSTTQNAHNTMAGKRARVALRHFDSSGSGSEG